MNWLLKVFNYLWQQICSYFNYEILPEPKLKDKSHKSQKLSTIRADQTRKKLSAANPRSFAKIPHAKGLIPIIGPLYALIAAGGAPKLHLYVNKRHKELGPIFSERLAGGLNNVIFVASSNLMRSVFLYEGHYPKHPLPDAWTLYNRIHKCQRGIFFMEGEEWLYHRRLLNRFLINNNMSWANKYIRHGTIQFMNEWETLTNKNPLEPVEISNLQHQLYKWATNVICIIMFGIQHTDRPRIKLAVEMFSSNVHKIFESSALLMNFPANLAKLLKLKIWSTFEQTIGEVLNLGAKIIDIFIEQLNDNDNIKSNENTTPTTLYQMLCEANVPLEIIKRIFVDLVIAAGDTTVFTCEWLLYILSKDSQIQEDIFKEINYNNNSTSSDIPLVMGLIKETLRLYPVAPFIGRFMETDGHIGNYFIKKDSLVLLSLYTSGRDPSHFPDPLLVKPTRWLRDKTTDKLPGVIEAHGTLPFAIGNRSCIGRKIALYQLSTFIIEVVKKFELSCLNAESIECILRMVAVPSEPLQLVIKSRIKSL